MRPGIPAVPDGAWFKSSYSGAGATECVEAAFAPGNVAVRDSKEPGGPVLTFAAEAWDAFLREVKINDARGSDLC